MRAVLQTWCPKNPKTSGTRVLEITCVLSANFIRNIFAAKNIQRLLPDRRTEKHVVLHGGLKCPSFLAGFNKTWGTRWRSWLRHCATSRNVAGSIPDGVIGIFHWHNPQPLTEMSTRSISWGGKDGRCVGLTTLPPSCADCLQIWEPEPPGTLRVCTGL
jgi:hypothetical protein